MGRSKGSGLFVLVFAWETDEFILHALRIAVLVPRLLPRNTLLARLLPRELVAGGRSLQYSAFQGWSPGTRIDSLIPGRVEYKPVRAVPGRA